MSKAWDSYQKYENEIHRVPDRFMCTVTDMYNQQLDKLELLTLRHREHHITFRTRRPWASIQFRRVLQNVDVLVIEIHNHTDWIYVRKFRDSILTNPIATHVILEIYESRYMLKDIGMFELVIKR